MKWIDETADGRKKKRKRGRRATDMPTTQRIPDMAWTINGEQEDAPRLSSYQRAVAALAVAAISISAVGVLALSSGAGLAGSLRGGGSDDPAQDIELSRIDVQSAGFTEETGSSELNSEVVDPPGTNGSNGAAHIATNGEDSRSANRVDTQEPTGLPTHVAQPATRTPVKPLVTTELLGNLQDVMDQGKVLHQAGLYITAVESFDEVRSRAIEALEEYRDDGTLERLVNQAEDEAERARLTCVRLNKPRCP